MDDKRKFARNLRHIRKAKGLTQEQLAELINRSPETVSHLERGISQPNLDTILNIRNALNVPLAEMIEPRRAENSSDPKREKLIQELNDLISGLSNTQIEAIIKNTKIIQSLSFKD